MSSRSAKSPNEAEHNGSTKSQSSAAVEALERRVRHLLEDHKRISELLRVVSDQLHTERSQVRSLKGQLQRAQSDISRLELTNGLTTGGRKGGGGTRGEGTRGKRARGEGGGREGEGERRGGGGAGGEWIDGGKWLDTQNEEEATAQQNEARKRAQARVNRLIREIDRCIDLINAMPMAPTEMKK